jgi:tRNA dimethylallyltransferase
MLPANIFILLGPTAVGKSDLAVDLAERINGEIIGADAFQVYRGLDILSAKPSPELRARVPHHLIGEIPITTAFDVAQYRALALPRIEDVASRGRAPIVCGGAGMYVRALTHGLSDTPSANPAIRAELEREPLDSLVARLRALDPDAVVDEKNPRRVIRALEVCLVSGRPFSSYREEWEAAPVIRGAILMRSRDSLHVHIAARTDAMFMQGVVEEVAGIGDLGPTAGQMLGLREIQQFLAGQLAIGECKAAIAQATRQYAKRQLTWFRREKGYEWIDLDICPDPVAELARLAKSP